MGIMEVLAAPRSPWQNRYVERVIGSIRRECLDYLIIFNERHLRRVLSSYEDYYRPTRTHLSRRTRIVHTCVPFSRDGAVTSSRFRRLAGCTIATNASQPEEPKYCLLFVARWLSPHRPPRTTDVLQAKISTTKP